MTSRTSSTAPSKAQSVRHLWICALLGATTLAAYAGVFGAGFVNYDDPGYVARNPHVLGGLSWPGIAWAFTTTAQANWHPLTWVSLMLDATIGGADPRVYHATNLALHLANTLLLFLVLGRMTRSLWKCAFVAGLFAVHPLHVESVAWVAERKDVLCGFFWFLTMAAYVRYAEHPSLARYAAVFVCFALALLSKPMAVTLPLVLFLIDLWPLGRWAAGGAASLESGQIRRSQSGATRSARPAGESTKRMATNTGAAANVADVGEVCGAPASLRGLLIEKLPLLALSAVSCVMTLRAQKEAIQPIEALGFSARAANAAISYVTYIAKMLFPHWLAVYYPLPRTPITFWKPAASLVVLAVVSWFAIRLLRTRPWFAIGWLWYLVTLAPVIGLVQVGSQALADRYTYLPLIGLFVVVAWGVPDLLQTFAHRERAGAGDSGAAGPRTPRAASARTPVSAGPLGALAACTLLAFAALTWVQVGYWRGTIELFRHALDMTTDNAVAHNDLADALYARGEIENAVVQLREAVRIMPEFADAHFNLTHALLDLGRVEEAAASCREEEAAWPSDERTFLDRALVALSQRNYDEAEARFVEAIQHYPDSPTAHLNLAEILVAKGRREEAKAHYRELARIIGPEKAGELERAGSGVARPPGVR